MFAVGRFLSFPNHLIRLSLVARNMGARAPPCFGVLPSPAKVDRPPSRGSALQESPPKREVFTRYRS